MKVIFHKLRYKNFLSFGNVFTEVQLDKARTTLVVGENGTGKSVLLDALCFGLFGKPFRKANKPTIVNSINNRDLLVEIEFSVNNKFYLIRRGIKPSVFEIYCDGVLINQSSSAIDYQRYLESTVIKLNYKSFTQVVILGSSTYVPFMLLPAAARREVIEDLLDIRVFSSMNTILKDRIMQNRTALENLDSKQKMLQSQIDFKQKHIDNVKSKLEEKNEKIDEDLDAAYALLNKKKNELVKCGQEIDVLNEKFQKKTKLLQKKQEKSTVKERINLKLHDVNKTLTFFKENDVCPTCDQDIDEEFKSKVISEKSEVNNKLQDYLQKVKESEQKILDMTKKFENVSNRISELRMESGNIEGQIEAQNRHIERLKYQKKQESHDFNLEDDEKELEKLQHSFSESNKEKEELLECRELYRVCSGLLKDGGIKTRIISYYVPIINKYINKYLQLMDFPVHFELDECFDEKIKSRYREKFSYSNFSEGERQRINLSLIFAWRAVAKLKNSVNTNLLIMDEVFDSSMDSDGVEALLDVMSMDGLLEGTNAVIMSHREVNLDRFDRTLHVTKDKNFSRMVGFQ